jgi:hypothetical protein
MAQVIKISVFTVVRSVVLVVQSKSLGSSLQWNRNYR